MPSFFQNLLSKLSPAKPARPEVWLSAFGKHPGWDDHIDDIGLDTDNLVNLKRLLYIQGIAGNIDSGAWDNLESDQQLSQFRHVFLWRTPDDLIAGRLWSSRDGKGRSKYPMIIAAEAAGLSAEWVLRNALPALEQVEADCAAAVEALQVIKAVDNARENLRRLAAAAPPATPTSGQYAMGRLAAHPDLGPDQHGLMLILYQIERELGAFRINGKPDRAASTAPRHMRVPACAADPAESLGLWLDFLETQLDPAVQLCLIAPLGQGWLDVIVGEPGAAQLFCFRASAKKLPLTTTIPYTLDPPFVDRARALIEGR